MEIDITKYLVDQVLILIPVLYIIGNLLKQSAVKDSYIPAILIAISIALSLGILGISVNSFIQGILVAGATVLANQLKKQAEK